MNLDMTKDPNAVTPGTFQARVQSVDKVTASSGTDMLNLHLVHDNGRKTILYANLMLGGGRWYVGHAWLLALQMDPKHTGEFEPQSLVGKRVWVATEAAEYKGKPRLEIDITKLTNKGMQIWHNVPDGCEAFGEDVPDTPF